MANAIQAIEHDGFPIAARVYMVVEGENLVTSAKSTGLGLVELATVFDNLKPDAVVTIATDTRRWRTQSPPRT
jgi:hypothetical protein